MKKKLIYSTAIAALFSASAVLAGGPEMVVMPPSPFDGFYVGGSIGYHHTGFDMTGNLDFVQNVLPFFPATINLADQNGGDSANSAYGGVHGGWGRVFAHRYYAGIEGFGDFGSNSGSITTNVVTLPFLAGPLLTVTNSAKVGDDWGVAARLGILLSPTTLAYAKLGVEWADLSSTVSTSVLGTPLTRLPATTSSSSSSGFLWGFGVEQFVWRDLVSVFAEYTYVNLGSVSTTSSWNFLPGFFFPPPNFFGVQISNNSSADVSSFTGGLNIHFGRNWF